MVNLPGGLRSSYDHFACFGVTLPSDRRGGTLIGGTDELSTT